MRDMLDKLKTISAEEEDDEPEFHGPEYDVDNSSLSHHAVVFVEPSAIDDVLREAHAIRKETSMLHLEVERLRINNERYGTSARRLSLLKKDSDSIAKEIQQRAETLHFRLQAFGTESSQLEEKEGLNAALSRIARAQYSSLTRAFHDVMNDYSEAVEMQRNKCRERIRRQASILGKEITNDNLDELVDKGGEGWTELSQSLKLQAPHSSRWALCDIKGRHKELVELEARMKEVHELFLDMAMLVENQGDLINNIEVNVSGTQDYIETVNVEIKRAIQYKRKNPFLQCCPCLPCWRHKQAL